MYVSSVLCFRKKQSKLFFGKLAKFDSQVLKCAKKFVQYYSTPKSTSSYIFRDEAMRGKGSSLPLTKDFLARVDGYLNQLANLDKTFFCLLIEI